jgi:signal transduction histidine kinase
MMRDEDSMLVLRVSDDGGGISAGERPATGGGLGMSTMRERAEELGGHLEVSSGSHGTTVVASLPLEILTAELGPSPTTEVAGSRPEVAAQ